MSVFLVAEVLDLAFQRRYFLIDDRDFRFQCWPEFFQGFRNLSDSRIRFGVLRGALDLSEGD